MVMNPSSSARSRLHIFYQARARASSCWSRCGRVIAHVPREHHHPGPTLSRLRSGRAGHRRSAGRGYGRGAVRVSPRSSMVCGEPAALVGMSAGGLMSPVAAARRSSPGCWSRPPAWSRHRPQTSALRCQRRIVWFEQPVDARRCALRDAAGSLRSSCLTDEMIELLCEDARAPETRGRCCARSNVGVLGLKRWRRTPRPPPSRRLSVVWGRQDRRSPFATPTAWRWFSRHVRHVLGLRPLAPFDARRVQPSRASLCVSR
jgi:hypothetical protein